MASKIRANTVMHISMIRLTSDVSDGRQNTDRYHDGNEQTRDPEVPVVLVSAREARGETTLEDKKRKHAEGDKQTNGPCVIGDVDQSSECGI